MENLILSQIPLADLITIIREAVREEMKSEQALNEVPANNKPVTQKELSKFLGVTPQTIIRWKKKKVIPFYTVGNAIRFDLQKVIKALGK